MPKEMAGSEIKIQQTKQVIETVKSINREEYLDARLADLEDHKNEMEKQPCLFEKNETDKIVDELKRNNQLEQVYTNIISRIQIETNYFLEMAEVGLYASLIENERSDTIGSTIIIDRKTKKPSDKTRGRYYGDLDAVLINEPRSDSTETISELAASGILPVAWRVMAHEFIHSAQEPLSLRAQAKLKLLKRLLVQLNLATEPSNPPKEPYNFREVHAERNATNPPQKTSVPDLINKINKKRRYKPSEETELITAIGIIDKLIALGYSPHEIGKLIRRNKTRAVSFSVGDKETVTFLNDEISKKRQELGMSEVALEKLVKADHLERQIACLRARQIAQEELKKADIKNKIT